MKLLNCRRDLIGWYQLAGPITGLGLYLVVLILSGCLLPLHFSKGVDCRCVPYVKKN